MGGSNSQDGIFYTNPKKKGKDSDGHPIFDRSKAVPAEFLKIGGQTVPDPYLAKDGGGSASYTLYSKLNADGTVDENSVFKNVWNYFIVPAEGYSVTEATDFASKINREIDVASVVAPGLGSEVGAASMLINFVPKGNQDYNAGRNTVFRQASLFRRSQAPRRLISAL